MSSERSVVEDADDSCDLGGKGRRARRSIPGRECPKEAIHAGTEVARSKRFAARAEQVRGGDERALEAPVHVVGAHRSTTSATASPPPMHSVARPRFAFLSSMA